MKMEMSDQQINDIVTATIIRTLRIMKETKDEGEDMNEVDFDYIIDCRMRDLSDPSVLDSLEMPDDNQEQV
jgi:tRNA A37 threonylcarbamoyladenosine dehydratase